jgi:hypothetical protein
MAAGCASHASSRHVAAPTTTLITQDVWHLPPNSGLASTENFCTLLVSTYRHIGDLPHAANVRVREAIVEDYVDAAPTIIAAAPSSIASQAKVYISAVAQILAAFERVGLNGNKLPKGQLGPLLLDPQIKEAGNQVLAYSQSECHYTIGGT